MSVRALGSRFSGQLLLLLSLAASSASVASPGAPALAWEPQARLLDLRLESARTLSALDSSDFVELALPSPVVVDGRRWNGLLVGHGWVRYLLRPAGEDQAEPGRAPALFGPRIDVLAGEAVRAEGGPVLWLARREGVAVRWTSLRLPSGGRATAELVIDSPGHATVQYLRLPDSGVDDWRAGRVRAGTSSPAGGLGLEPRAATAFRLPQPVLGLRPPQAAGGGPLPPPPAGCESPGATWCEQADGPDSSLIFVTEHFDDAAADTRGWTWDSLWHPSDWPTCVLGEAGGATTDPGGAMYFGVDATCSYQDDLVGTLSAPQSFGRVTADTVMTFEVRLGIESGFDFAEVLFNGDVVGNLNGSGLEIDQWYGFRLGSVNEGETWFQPYLGQRLVVEFRFTSDNSNSNFLGWFVDDVEVWDQAQANPNCLRELNGRNGIADCSQTVSTSWQFDESDFCQGCTYTFYVRVECGREMHLPLEDMEGARVEITNLVTGSPVPLRCLNETVLADAGLGPYPIYRRIDCCPPLPEEEYWGPPFDVVDNAGPGVVEWGFPDCPGLSLYDVDVPRDGVQCDELPCGGELSLISPGESQVMDCFIEDPAGLCGLYRVDITSGGFVWNLFANCDGTDTPQFEIYQDCTEAWEAYNPLPELAIANFSSAGACPDLDVSFDVLNLGCVEHAGDLVVRLESDCDPPDVLDQVVPGPFPPNSSRPVTFPFVPGCAPVRIEVFADPDDLVPECTESAGVAACSAEEGVDSLVGVACGCDATPIADAGPDLLSCAGAMVTLDGSASSVLPCATPLYRWLDSMGAELSPPSPSPTFAVPFDGCPAGVDYTLEVSCQGEPCTARDIVRVECAEPTADAGGDSRVCAGEPVLLDASASAIPGCAAVEFRWLDPAGAEIAPWSAEPTLELGPLDCAANGSYTVEVRCPSAGSCFASDTVDVACVQAAVQLVSNTRASCEGSTVEIVPGDATVSLQECSDAQYRWYDQETDTPLTNWRADEALSVDLDDCPSETVLRLEARCADAGFQDCVSSDLLTVTCPKPEAPVPTVTYDCGTFEADLACGVAEPGASYWWDLDTGDDSDANGDPADDRDRMGCDVRAAYPDTGVRVVRAWAEEGLAGCLAFTDTAVDIGEPPAPPTPSAEPACAGATTLLHCGVADPELAYSWDVDVATDSDGNGTADDDVDRVGCDPGAPFPEGTTTAKVTATDGRGCTSSATVDVTTLPGIIPGEVPPSVRVARDGAQLRLDWEAATEAETYRVLRGRLGEFYDHAADPPAGRGSCDTGGLLFFVDLDDGTYGTGPYYFLVGATSSCGADGSLGSSSDAVDRPPRVSLPSCP